MSEELYYIGINRVLNCTKAGLFIAHILHTFPFYTNLRRTPYNLVHMKELIQFELHCFGRL